MNLGGAGWHYSYMVGLVLVFALLHRQTTEGPPAYLLGSPEIRREIGVSHEASASILTLLSRARWLNSGGLMTIEMSNKREAERKKTPPETLERQAVQFLSPAQSERLWQLHFQRSEPWMLNFPGIKGKLGVTDKVYARIQKLQSGAYSVYKRMLDKTVKKQTDAQARQRAKRASTGYRETCKQALYANLTPEQKAKLRTILGKPFDMDTLHYDVHFYSRS